MEYRARYSDGSATEWRTIPELPAYSACSDGRIRRDAPTVVRGKVQRVPDGSPLTPRIINKRSGHWGVTLSMGGRAYHRLVHRLVAACFLPEPRQGDNFVCHKNGDPSDNRAENLYWGNGTTNASDRTAHGRTLRGNMVGNSKLQEEDVRRIRLLTEGGVSQSVIAQEFGVSKSLISMINTRRVWGHI